MVKVTKKEVITKALTLDVWSEEEREIFQNMITALEKKSSKPTKTQIANETIKTDILTLLADGRARTATEVGIALDISCQKASALIKPLVDGGTVIRIEGKGKNPNKFAVAD